MVKPHLLLFSWYVNQLADETHFLLVSESKNYLQVTCFSVHRRLFMVHSFRFFGGLRRSLIHLHWRLHRYRAHKALEDLRFARCLQDTVGTSTPRGPHSNQRIRMAESAKAEPLPGFVLRTEVYRCQSTKKSRGKGFTSFRLNQELPGLKITVLGILQSRQF